MKQDKRFLNSIKRRILFYTGVPVTIILSAAILLFASRMFSELLHCNKQSIQSSAALAAKEIDRGNLAAVSVVKTMALAQENGLFGKRKESSVYARKVLEGNPQFTGTSFGYEPDADQSDAAYLAGTGGITAGLGEDGRFLPYWYVDTHDDGKIKLNALIDMETSLYYQGVKERFLSGTREYLITEPYVYEGKMIVEQMYPIVINGRFAGIAGVDRALEDIHDFLVQLKPYESAEFILISRLHRIISATMNPDLKTMEIDGTAYREILRPFFLGAGPEGVVSATDPTDGDEYFFAGAVIPTGDWHVIMRVARDEIIHPIRNTVVWVAALSILGMLVMLTILAWVAKSITTPVQAVVNVAQRVAGGDLTDGNAVEVTGDETGQLVLAIHVMTQNLNRLISEVRRSGDQLSLTASQIAAAASAQETTISDLGVFANEIVAAVREISSTAGELAHTMSDVARVSAEAGQLADAGRSGLAKMESTMAQLLNANSVISSRLAVLNKKANSINTMVTTISKVADQTNLLSLNASIEAEKAGDFGAGFAVVANEIRRLADQTAIATLDIEEMVKEMMSAVSSGVLGMEKFTGELELAVKETGTAGAQLSRIIERVGDLTPKYKSVNEGMQLQSERAERISHSISRLSRTMDGTLASTQQFKRATRVLDQSVGGLQLEVANFRLSPEDDSQPRPRREKSE